MGSQCGDCQVIRLDPDFLASSSASQQRSSTSHEPAHLMQIDEEGESDAVNGGQESSAGFEVVDAWSNVGPILDFCVVSKGASGAVSRVFNCNSKPVLDPFSHCFQSQIVTASGYGSAGSIRMISSGVDTNIVAELEGLGGISMIFPFSWSTTNTNEMGLFLSSANRTILVRLTTSDLEDGPTVDLQPVDTEQVPYLHEDPTIAVGQLSATDVIQITKDRMAILVPETQDISYHWNHDMGSIAVAACSGPWVVVGTTQGDIALFRYHEKDEQLEPVG